MKKERLRYLIDVSKRGTASPSEQRELIAWYAGFEQDPGYTEQLTTEERNALNDRMWADFERTHFHSPWGHRGRYRLLAAAAVVVLSITVVALIYTYYTTRRTALPSIATETSFDLPPGGNRATLTLADGRLLELSTEQRGIVVGDGILRYDDGQLISDEGRFTADKGQLMSPVNLRLATPRGGTYQIILSDGSRVWLNAESVLEYPDRFAEDERLVRLKGEAYFEIAKAEGDTPIPFRVEVGGQLVEVTGTEFNLSAYADDPMVRTTLVEGALTVHTLPESGDFVSHGTSIELLPGEEGILENGGLSKRPANVRVVTAWKQGDFMFDDEPLESIMNKLARWYDVEIVFQDAPRDVRLYGIVSRSKNISTVLEVLEMTERVKFRIEKPRSGQEERRVVVMR